MALVKIYKPSKNNVISNSHAQNEHTTLWIKNILLHSIALVFLYNQRRQSKGEKKNSLTLHSSAQ
jgi:hypothetical protein